MLGSKRRQKKSGENFSATLRALLSNRGFVDSLDYRCRTPLMLAAAANLLEAVKILVRSGSDLNASDIDGNTALHFAYGFGCATVAVYLESQGIANTEAKNHTQYMPIEMSGRVSQLMPVFLPLSFSELEALATESDVSIVAHSKKWDTTRLHE